jgi:hypothetical protein
VENYSKTLCNKEYNKGKGKIPPVSKNTACVGAKPHAF